MSTQQVNQNASKPGMITSPDSAPVTKPINLFLKNTQIAADVKVFCLKCRCLCDAKGDAPAYNVSSHHLYLQFEKENGTELLRVQFQTALSKKQADKKKTFALNLVGEELGVAFGLTCTLEGEFQAIFETVLVPWSKLEKILIRS